VASRSTNTGAAHTQYFRRSLVPPADDQQIWRTFDAQTSPVTAGHRSASTARRPPDQLDRPAGGACEKPRACGVVNELVAMRPTVAHPVVIADGAEFYSSPLTSPRVRAWRG